MKPTNEKPVSAQTAGAMDTLNVSEYHNVQQVNKNSDGHYIGDNNERLFTSDEVNTLIRERLDRQLKTLLSKYEISSKEELDSLVSLAKKMNEVYKTFNSSNETNIERKTKQMEQQPLLNKNDASILDVINLLKDREFCSISFIQKSLAMGFSRAGKYFNALVDADIIDRHGDARGCKVNQEKLNELLNLSLEEIKEKLLNSSVDKRMRIDKLYELNQKVLEKKRELTTYRDFLRYTNKEETKVFEIEITKCILLCDHLISREDEKEQYEYQKLDSDFQEIKKKMLEFTNK